MSHAWITLLIFLGAYALFIIVPSKRAWVACGGAALLVASGCLTWHQAVLRLVSWNVMGLFFGTLVLAELFLLSKAPAVMAEWLVDRTSTARAAMLALCALAGLLSMFVENVAVVLLLAPVALSLAEKLRINPVQLLIGIAVSSNLQGTATMIGDPPSMILAGFMKMGFFDFMIYHGRPGIFFAVELGALASLAVLAYLFRRHREAVALLRVETCRSWVPAGLLALLIAGLALSTAFDPDFRWYAAVLTLSLALLGSCWYRYRARWGTWRKLAAATDWNTTFFLIGVFILAGGLSESGWLDRLADWMARTLHGSLPLTFAVVVVFAVCVSAFVDNVPFLLTMIPVVQRLAAHAPEALPLLMFGLLIGACLGGNLTPIGASANVVTLGLLGKRGHVVSFREFAEVGLPFTLAAVAAACAFVWFVWAP